MHTQDKKSWVLLTSLAACAGLATTPAFAVQPDASSFFGKHAEVQSELGEISGSTYIIKLLEGSAQFRVRAQAAISLGTVDKSLTARRALTAALRDLHPAVRAAAATSLGRIGDADHLMALRELERDVEAPVRNAAHASIGRLESTLEAPSVVLDTAETTAAVSATINAHRM